MPRYRPVQTVRLYEARTGKHLAEKGFRGSVPSCPEWVDKGSVSGDEPDEAVQAWLAGYGR